MIRNTYTHDVKSVMMMMMITTTPPFTTKHLLEAAFHGIHSSTDIARNLHEIIKNGYKLDIDLITRDPSDEWNLFHMCNYLQDTGMTVDLDNGFVYFDSIYEFYKISSHLFQVAGKEREAYIIHNFLSTLETFNFELLFSSKLRI